MPRLSCRELGGDCDFVVEAGSPAEAKQELLRHVSSAHHARLARMSEDEREALDVRIDRMLLKRPGY